MNTNVNMKNWETVSTITHEGELVAVTYKRKPAPTGYKDMLVTIHRIDLSYQRESPWFGVDTEATKDDGVGVLEVFNPQCVGVITPKGDYIVKTKEDYHPLAIEENLEKILKDIDALIKDNIADMPCITLKNAV